VFIEVNKVGGGRYVYNIEQIICIRACGTLGGCTIEDLKASVDVEEPYDQVKAMLVAAQASDGFLISHNRPPVRTVRPADMLASRRG